jgi:hypothetical protein
MDPDNYDQWGSTEHMEQRHYPIWHGDPLQLPVVDDFTQVNVQAKMYRCVRCKSVVEGEYRQAHRQYHNEIDTRLLSLESGGGAIRHTSPINIAPDPGIRYFSG